jgi:hypothetical protein
MKFRRLGLGICSSSGEERRYAYKILTENPLGKIILE